MIRRCVRLVSFDQPLTYRFVGVYVRPREEWAKGKRLEEDRRLKGVTLARTQQPRTRVDQNRTTRGGRRAASACVPTTDAEQA